MPLGSDIFSVSIKFQTHLQFSVSIRLILNNIIFLYLLHPLLQLCWVNDIYRNEVFHDQFPICTVTLPWQHGNLPPKRRFLLIDGTRAIFFHYFHSVLSTLAERVTLNLERFTGHYFQRFCP